MSDTVDLPRAGLRDGLPWSTILKNAVFFAVVIGAWLALETGYLSPDRPTRSQWEQNEKAKTLNAGVLVYEADFGRERPGTAKSKAAYWGYYNGATPGTVEYDSGGVTVNYSGVPWIGAALHFPGYEPGRIYRITVERDVQGEPGAIIVRNRQLDLMRARVATGTGTFAMQFVAPRGSRDRVVVALIPDNPDKPEGSMRITSLKIERLGE